MICDSSISDGGWGAACYNAMVDACKRSGWSYEVTDSIDQSAYYESIAAYCDLGYNLIYAPGNQYTDAVLQAAEEYPDIAFALLNGAEDTPGKATNKNVSSLLPNAQQIGWIAGRARGPHDQEQHHRLHRRHGARYHARQVQGLHRGRPSSSTRTSRCSIPSTPAPSPRPTRALNSPRP
jgi:hypothetical protein